MVIQKSPQTANIQLLEQQKENIQPLSGGRSATKLTKALSSRPNSATSINYQEHRTKLEREREELEQKLLDSDELDDPLQVYIEYINWVHYNFPQGANADSGLVILLEKCTSKFRDVSHYKNDPRYLKIWLEYTNYSDSPRDIYVYLAKKEIGNQLALYYEEFARYLEVQKKYTDANQIYELGIQSNAFPLKRLQKSYENFKERLQLEMSSVSTTSDLVREALKVKRGSSVEPGAHVDHGPIAKKPRLEVFKDDDDQNQSVLHLIFGASLNDDIKLNSTKQRIKENTISATAWKGQVLKQKVPTPPNSSGGKIQVFRDFEPLAFQAKKSICYDEKGRAYTLIENPGKKSERVLVNMDLIYPDESQEFGMLELLAISRRSERQKQQKQTLINHPTVVDEDTRTITLALNNSSTIKSRDMDPTITMNGNLAHNELQGIYNELGYGYNFDDEDEKVQEPTVTNYDGYVTETINPPTTNANLIPTQVDSPQIDQVATPPTDREEEFDDRVLSSPFVEQPVANTQPVDPFDIGLQESFLDNLSIPMSTYSGYYDKSTTKVDRIRKFREITNKNQTINRGSSSAIIDYCGQELYCLLHELGQGGYGFVYLIEAGSTGKLKALKIETPSSRWEFYILHQVHRRLIGEAGYKQRYFIRAEALYYFQDESFLILDYCSQSTLLDVVNNYKNKGSSLEECLVIFFTVELLKALEALHSVGILHGDLKADNCMVRFEPINESDWSERYDRSGKFGWSHKSITLIDFGRAVDMTLFSSGTRFVSSFKADEQDCPQMNEGTPWSYEADYYGLATIIHTLLFGSYIKIKKDGSKIKLHANFKRYWQHELWQDLFELLLNPYSSAEVNHAPRTESLATIREHFENWLESNSKMKYLKGLIKMVEGELNSINRARVN
ncbi:checkpoint serine/threonine-protein kinase [Candida albicans P57055]|nr:checkpoint serine/threonine-protein kinase [Candida albicans P57055]